MGPVLNISDEALVELALDLASKSSSIPKEAMATCNGSNVTVLDKMSGANNRVFVIQYHDGPKVCVRVPCCGWEGAWMEKDVEALRSQVLTMRYIKRHTNCPIPEVITYDTTFNNAIHAPHVVTLYIEGRPISEGWWEADEGKRQNMLRSLAFAAAKLRTLTFDKMGALRFSSDEDDSPEVGPCHLLDFGVSRTPSFLEYIDEQKTDAQPSSEAHLRRTLDEWKQEVTEPGEEGPNPNPLDLCEYLGTHRLYSMLLDAMPFPNADEPDRFAIAPPDFDQQNILTDDDGNVTAMLDWDRVETAPCYAGPCSFPHFLYPDWQCGKHFAWPHWAHNTMPPMQYDQYRADYTRYMKEACNGEGDCEYTAKSHLFSRMADVAGRTAAQDDFLGAVLAVVVPRVDAQTLMQYIGDEGLTPEEEKVIREGFKKLLAI